MRQGTKIIRAAEKELGEKYLKNFLHLVKTLQNWEKPSSQRIKKHSTHEADK